ncbi:trna-guanine transglycosylase family protein [Moniliophthora roreri MCA 2997]|uniref:Trna-guanine transglycosylase family protein n=2 Tax=Moniliophthora roreri TaxID=221103 RepID=V2YVS4_MONRO|nr:trna-guanine transglycosylase family protein [Moniliophthora roreri MCA 2997]KAI3616083.1 trna-guanine transglycosylase family protein [Moniliophthora roreri]
MALSFQLSPTVSTSSSSKFGPRVGQLTFKDALTIPTPNILAPTSRGVVSHLSRDNLLRANSITWIHVPFESFLECKPPILTLGSPAHDILGFKRDKHIVSMSLRDLSDGREMPPNTAKFVTAWCVRGVRKVTPEDWKEYVSKAQPDVVYALVDSQPVTSQKRLMKSVERTAEWLVHLLKPTTATTEPYRIPPILLQMPGNQSVPARSAFARTLVEPLHPTEIDALKPLQLSCLDDSVIGYVVDGSVELMRASLDLLNANKPRIAHTSSLAFEGLDQIRGPHDMLTLIRDVGIDMFGAEWAVKLAQWGVALDFEFPAPAQAGSDAVSGPPPQARKDGKRDIGHNIYHVCYRTDFTPLINSQSTLQCHCIACKPLSCETVIRHSVVDAEPEFPDSNASHTRAYIHHLLHTHEMSAHSLLVSHNVEVISMFLAGVRHVLSTPDQDFTKEVKRFFDYYNAGYATSGEIQGVAEKVAEVVEAVVEESKGLAGGFEVGVETGGTTPPVTAQVKSIGIGIALYDEAHACWAEVERLRGKGSLKRERPSEREVSTEL